MSNDADEAALREATGWHADGHMYVYFGYADPDRAPVLDTADGPVEALGIMQRQEGVMYRYRDDDHILRDEQRVSIAEVEQLIAEQRRSEESGDHDER